MPIYQPGQTRRGARSMAGAPLDGVTVYQMTESGPALQKTVKGTKYWKDTGLNLATIFRRRPARTRQGPLPCPVPGFIPVQGVAGGRIASVGVDAWLFSVVVSPATD